MKIIISHDVDHLYRRDHYRDLILIKRIVRSILELIKREISFKECVYNVCEVFSHKQHHIDGVMEFDRKSGIPSTFFFGMKNGLGMNYSVKDAEPIIRAVKENGFSVGVHGIAYNQKEEMRNEYDIFRKIVNTDDFGIRMHYVQYDESTFPTLSQLGYLFDTSEFDKKKGYCLKKPYRIGGMWEFPLCIMDGYLPKTFEAKKEMTKKLLDEGEQSGLKFFTVLFHDAFFSEAFMSMKTWYKWFVEYLKEEGYEFVSYIEAMKELERMEPKSE